MEIFKTKYLKEIFIIALVDSLTSLFYFAFPLEGFRITLSVVFILIFLTIYKDINPIVVLTISGFMQILFRSVGTFIIFGVDFKYAFLSSYQEMAFYVLYGVLFNYLYSIDRQQKPHIKFMVILCCDFIANMGEVLLRMIQFPYDDIYSTISTLAVAVLLRTIVSFTIITLMKYHELFIVKEEHEKKYKNLVSLVSSMKSELYFMNMNTEHLENVMENSYNLYDLILEKKLDKEVKNISLNIAKDVHEIKKDYLMVITGLDKIMENKIEYNEMKLKDVFDILQENTKRYLESEDKEIEIKFNIKSNEYIREHYSLMSIFRNLINNSIEAMDNTKDNKKIVIEHREYKDNHVFNISDNGKGIKNRDLSYIFEPRFSMKFDENTGNIGRGIGLTLVKDIVENKFKGKIKVKSQYHKGTKFNIEIPKKSLEVITDA
ncbi:sensor histidine kinase [Dethiothermospora halolimnae]|uniref:sensor histidine kinase n=1 Tax=Dethiothermospora halolimnae TaxID=3114390 RepID=UPI003CCBDBB1